MKRLKNDVVFNLVRKCENRTKKLNADSFSKNKTTNAPFTRFFFNCVTSIVLGEELAQTQNGLTHSHSNSTDSGIQSVGGEDLSSSSAASPAVPGNPISSYLVHRVFGGELKVSYQCLQCENESHNTDRFRDLQLCFFETLEPSETVTVQDLIKLNYYMPERLTGDNKYKCSKCDELCDAQRSMKIVQAPAHLILTLKHFRYVACHSLDDNFRFKNVFYK